MIGFLTGLSWKAALTLSLALAGVVDGGIQTVRAHLTPDYAAVVAAAGPVVPGSFHVVGEGDVAEGHLVIYTVRRPGHPGLGLGAILTILPDPWTRDTAVAMESISFPGKGAVQRYDSIPEQGGNLMYGFAPGTHALLARTSAGQQRVAVDPRGGFYLIVPLSDSGAGFTPIGG